MIIGLIDQIEEWLHCFTPTDSILDTVGPSSILEGKIMKAVNKARVPFGAYVLTYIGTTNTMDPRSVHAIALNSANNFGRYFFFF